MSIEHWEKALLPAPAVAPITAPQEPSKEIGEQKNPANCWVLIALEGSSYPIE